MQLTGCVIPFCHLTVTLSSWLLFFIVLIDTNVENCQCIDGDFWCYCRDSVKQVAKYRILAVMAVRVNPIHMECLKNNLLIYGVCISYFNIVRLFICDTSLCCDSTRVLISPYPDQEGNKLRSMSGTRTNSTTSWCELSSSFFPARQGT